MDEREIPRFGRQFLTGEDSLSRIGGGGIGGKAHGLARAVDLLGRGFPRDEFPSVAVEVPRFVVLGTEVFDRFLERNELTPEDLGELSDDRIAHRFLGADMPVEFLGDLRSIVGEVHTPLAVRSSSLLEDALARPFAGVYETKMIPNHQPEADSRFRRLVEAIKLVYASTFFRQAREYPGVSAEERQGEKMAVVVQEVVGSRRGTRFYPDVSGVARSIDFYSVPPGRPADGVGLLAHGLGKTIVDGGMAWRFSPTRPKAPPPFASAADRLRGTQLSFWAVNMGPPPPYDPMHEAEFLLEGNLRDAEIDGTLRFTASTYDAASDRLAPGIGAAGPRVLDFAPLLVLTQLPLAAVVRTLLRVCEEDLGQPVEIELALTIDRRGPTARLGFLQVRPMVVAEESIEVTDEDLASPDLLLASEKTLGNGLDESIRDVVYVRPDVFETKYTSLVAAEVDRLNRTLREAGRPYLLIGFGRWGSIDPWLGIPVAWSQVAGARAIVEATLPDLDVEPSQGSHFFHNLTSFRTAFFHVSHGGRFRIAWERLDEQPAATETRFLRHVRLDRALRTAVDGRRGRGGIWWDRKTEGSAE